jgi:two-component system, OmpR family, response regulator ChvI
VGFFFIAVGPVERKGASMSIASGATGTLATGEAVDAPKGRVITVEDDDDFREILTLELEDSGFEVGAFPDAPSALQSISTVAAADVILLDWSLPGTSGIELLSQLRSLGVDQPAVFLTGRALTDNEMVALDHGAADFIDKSRGLDVLIRRLRLITEAKPTQARQEDRLVRGRLEAKLGRGRIFWDGRDVGLTFVEFRIVHLLASNAGRHVTYREIYDCMRSPGFIAGTGENGYRMNVRSAIKRIREKFRNCDPNFAEIENDAGIGYAWGPVEGSLGQPSAATS